MCGEEGKRIGAYAVAVGTPPRVWGRVNIFLLVLSVFGDTPTCVGKSHQHVDLHVEKGGHPHVCGEEIISINMCFFIIGTPPRVWGRGDEFHIMATGDRDTPTCVGKS